LGNLIARAKRGSINNFWDGVGVFFQGFLAGAVAGPSVITSITSFNQLGVVVGTLGGIFYNDWTIFNNSSKITLGSFYIDENRTFIGGLWQGISRYTWEHPQTVLGNDFSQLRNIFGQVDRVEYLGGATFSINEKSKKEDGISIGNFINININGKIEGDFTEYVLTHPLFMHKYGHYIDSQTFGLTYMLNIAIPSFFSAMSDEKEDGIYKHNYRWYEMNANKNANKYFNKHYGNRVNWSLYEPSLNHFPTKKPKKKKYENSIYYIYIFVTL
jgi:hypothetical protein